MTGFEPATTGATVLPRRRKEDAPSQVVRTDTDVPPKTGEGSDKFGL